MKKTLLLFIIFLVFLCGCTTSGESSNSSDSTIKQLTSQQQTLCEEAVQRFSISINKPFEQGERFSVDELISYYTLFYMRSKNGDLLPNLKQYQTNKNNYEIRIPKGIVNNFLSSTFMVSLDDTNSIYYEDGNADYYILNA